VKKNSIFLLVVGIGLLLLFQQKAIMPLVYKVIQSDLFLKDTEDQGSRESISNAMTDAAFNQCNEYIKDELGEKYLLSFSNSPINTWGLGNYEYLINADISISDKNNAAKTERYVCRIQLDKSGENTDTLNKENWSILGVTGIEEL
jgi:hypothetical protein